ncbi:MAG: radical SAM protein [Dehalococcoidia bacterium]
MISVSRMLCDEIGPGDYLRYGHRGELSPASEARPIVVWNCTRKCNLHCVHCYASASSCDFAGEMTTAEGKAFIRQLAHFGVPVLLFSGGEPLLRDDFFELAEFAAGEGLGLVISTNGTLITPDVAARIVRIGFREVGISLDGIGEKNDHFRGHKGAFASALAGIRNCISAGQRVSLRMTITRANQSEISDILDLVERQNIDRVCFYHLAYAGRGNDMRGMDLSHAETRAVVDLICERTLDLYERGLRKEILLVANHTDGVYLYLKAQDHQKERAAKVLDLLRINGGNSSGIRIGAVDEQGDVHPDQFWRSLTLGNVRRRAFGDIWMDLSNPVMRGLKDRKALLKGRCRNCKYLDICNGNLRSRAEAVFNDMWADDPSCYLTDEEIGIPVGAYDHTPLPNGGPIH